MREIVARALAAQLLTYPESNDDLEDQRTIAAGLPAEYADPLLRYCDAALATPLLQRQAEYVATFDQKRKCCLYLSYYLNGDTRLRGMALVRFKEAYAAAGLQMTDSELPDFLPVVLEFGIDQPDEAVALLQQHRRGLELLRSSLRQLDSAYADVIEAVVATLPPASEAEIEAASLLAVQGPPAEQVGLEPFGPAELTGVGVRS
jgi:nitrate reductase molybdenum cofactor assembly chaperone NarJ/NarW